MRILIIITALFISSGIYAQELIGKVNVTTAANQNMQVDKSIFDNLQNALQEFIYGTKWTEHNFTDKEKIECSFSLNITEVNGSSFKATLTMQSSRPAFNSTYLSPMLNLIDKQVAFTYIDNQNLEFNETNYGNNLVGILAFYIYMTIGYDYDSFAPMGGTPFFERAKEIAIQGENMNIDGWKSNEKGRRNRFWMVENLLSSNFEVLRMMNYNYHRLGLDIMHNEPEKGRAAITEQLMIMDKMYQSDASSYMLRIYFDSKSNEIIGIIRENSKEENQKLIEYLAKADVKNATKYEELLQ